MSLLSAEVGVHVAGFEDPGAAVHVTRSEEVLRVTLGLGHSSWTSFLCVGWNLTMHTSAKTFQGLDIIVTSKRKINQIFTLESHKFITATVMLKKKIS